MVGCRDVRELVDRVAARGDAPCLAVGAQAVASAPFALRVRALAQGLRSAGLRPGDRVAIYLQRSIEEAELLLATMLAGGIAVPVHPRTKDAQLAHVLADCEPSLIVTSATKTALLADAATLLRGRRVYRVGPPLAAVEAVDVDLLRQATVGPLPQADPSAPAILLYTSGSTGLAKGVVQSAHNLLLGAAVVAGYLGLSATDHVLCLLPFSFDYGLNQLLSGLHTGARVTAADYLARGDLAALLRSVRPTGLAGVPALWHEVAAGLEQRLLHAADGRSLRYVTNSGGRLVPQDGAAIRRHWPWVRVFSMFGLTEAFRSAYLPAELYDQHPDSFGRALPGVELLLVEPGTASVLLGPATGELVHAGALVGLGYWRRPEATARRFRPDPRGGSGTVVYTGDLVRRDANGLHYFVGRLDAMLKVAGHRISPDEVAQAVRELAASAEIAVFGLDGGSQGHRIVLCLGTDAADPDLADRVLRQCRARLPAHMVPHTVHVLSRLPRTANGKIDFTALRGLLEARCTGEP